MLPQARFHLTSHWLVPGPASRVAAILTRPQDFPAWWGDVYLSVHTLTPGDAQGSGRTVEVLSKGRLPWHLRWQARLVSADLPLRWTIAASGDLNGQGVWTLEPQGGEVYVTYDWHVTSDRLLFRALAPLLHPLMTANHRWAMAKGEEGLKQLLEAE